LVNKIMIVSPRKQVLDRRWTLPDRSGEPTMVE
jgi:hypothetical protein